MCTYSRAIRTKSPFIVYENLHTLLFLLAVVRLLFVEFVGEMRFLSRGSDKVSDSRHIAKANISYNSKSIFKHTMNIIYEQKQILNVTSNRVLH